MASRISKSSVDWAKFAKLVPKHNMPQYNTFKAKSDEYLVRVLSNPEKPPEVDWNNYKANITNKDVVTKLEAAYKSLVQQVPYPQDTISSQIDDQAKQAKAEYKLLCQISNEKIKECEELQNKYKVMIPYGQMTNEDYALTFPDYVYSRKDPSIWPNEERAPGLTKEEREQIKIGKKHGGAPYTLP